MKALGPVGDKDAENEVLLLEHEIPHQQFSENVLKDLPSMPWSISAEVKTLQSVNCPTFDSTSHLGKTKKSRSTRRVRMQRRPAR